MRQQIAKGFAMLGLVMALALATAVVTANAQSPRVSARVPFEFIVGDKALPAGEYNFTSVTDSNSAMRVWSKDRSAAAIRLTLAADGASKTAKLVFHRYGQRYFLAEIWAAGGVDGRQLTKSRQERAIEMEDSRIAAVNGRTPQPTYEKVAIALN